jgi:microcystin-dependent protein
MSTPFMGEVKLISWNFAPQGWAFCSGQFLPINQNQALFSILGTTYGGNGQTTFALPDLRGRVPIHTGPSSTLGQAGGQEAHTLTQQEMPAHNHVLQGSTNANNFVAPSNTTMSGLGAVSIYAPAASLTTLLPATISNTGGSQPHMNMQPYTVVNFIIALQGIFPSRN